MPDYWLERWSLLFSPVVCGKYRFFTNYVKQSTMILMLGPLTTIKLPQTRFLHVFFPIVTVRRCGPQPVLPHTSVSSAATDSDAVIVYRCMYGYGFTDLASTKSLRCNPDTLQWDTQPGDFLYNMTCERKL